MNVGKIDPLIHFPCKKLETTGKRKQLSTCAVHIGTINYFDDYIITLLKTVYLAITNHWVGYDPPGPPC